MPPKKKKTTEEDDAVPEPVAKKSRPKKKEEREATQADAEEEPLLKKRRTSSGPVITEEAVRVNTIPFVRRNKENDFDGATMSKIISWNVAGLRAVCKGTELTDLVEKEKPDVLAIQEVRIQDLAECARTGVLPGYTFVDCVCMGKKGYSGTRTYVKDGFTHEHMSQGFTVDGAPRPDEEGRVVTSLLGGGSDTIALVNSYVPNSGLTLDRLGHRIDEYDPLVRGYLKELNAKFQSGGVIWTGDLNVAERDYDRFFNNFKQMQKCPGFTPEERASFRQTLSESGMVDSFRHLYPQAHDTYTFWSKRFSQKERNNGWRLDYFIVSPQLLPKVVDVFPLAEGYDSSDHAPLVMWLKK